MTMLINPYRFGTSTPPAWSPEDLTDLMSWYEAEDVAGSDLDPVGTWNVRAGTNGALAQATGTAQPLYRTNAGDPYIQFDGTDDQMVATAAKNNVVMLAIVARRLSAAADIDHFLEASDGTSTAGVLGAIDSEWWVWNGTDTIRGGAVDNDWHVLVARLDGSNGYLRLDGSLAQAANVGTRTRGAELRVAGARNISRFMQMDTKAIVTGGTGWTAGEIADLETYLLAKI